MELKTAINMGKELAEYFVYYCGEGEHYVPLMDKLREANTRSSLLKSCLYSSTLWTLTFKTRYGERKPTEHG